MVDDKRCLVADGDTMPSVAKAVATGAFCLGAPSLVFQNMLCGTSTVDLAMESLYKNQTKCPRGVPPQTAPFSWDLNQPLVSSQDGATTARRSAALGPNAARIKENDVQVRPPTSSSHLSRPTCE